MGLPFETNSNYSETIFCGNPDYDFGERMLFIVDHISAGKEFNVKFRATEELDLAWRFYQEKRTAGRTRWILIEQVRVRGSIHSIHE